MATITGTAGNDTKTGTALSDWISGLAGNDKLSGLAGNDTLHGGVGLDTLDGGDGEDTYVIDNVGDVIIDSSGAADRILSSISINLTNAKYAPIEHVTLLGTANLNATGDADANHLIGNAGANVLSGGAGFDTMIGGAGNDTYVVTDAFDLVIEDPDQGTDRIITSISLGLFGNVENLTLAGTGNIDGTGNLLANIITGNAGSNSLSGDAGNDTLNGGASRDVLDGGAGADSLVGGIGNDIYRVDVAGDKVVEDANAGIDIVTASLNYTLGANVEYLRTSGTNLIGTGNSLANDMRVASGNARLNGLTGNDTLVGLAGNDTLDGGAGTDNMNGGAGDDSYVVDNAADAITDSSGLNDRILGRISINLNDAKYAAIEHVALLGTANLNATGDADNNKLTGNTGANALNGGVGADTMTGGAGNDTYVVDDFFDQVLEDPGQGTDRVIASIEFDTINNPLFANVENLTLVGTANLLAHGNALANRIVGNAGINSLFGDDGNDTLIGGAGDDRLVGGDGADSLVGGIGDDIYEGIDALDELVEAAGEGVDTVRSVIAYALGANIERLELVGSDTINGTGNSLGNDIEGNDGNNVLRGEAGDDTLRGGLGSDLLLGGAGNDVLISHDDGDTLVGGAGRDVFKFESLNLVSGSDTIRDFNAAPGGDVLDFSDMLTGYVDGVSDPNDFVQCVVGGGVTTLFVDRDGTGASFGFTNECVLEGVSVDLNGLINNGAIDLVA